MNAASLKSFLRKGKGTLPYPGCDVTSLDLWYACNLESSSAAEQPPLLSRLVDALFCGENQPWKGKFARQVSLILIQTGMRCLFQTCKAREMHELSIETERGFLPAHEIHSDSGRRLAWTLNDAEHASVQADILTHYLAQLLVARLVQKENLSMENAMFESSHLRLPILQALDAAWQSVITVRSLLALAHT